MNSGNRLLNGLDHGVDVHNIHFLVWIISVPVLYFLLVVVFRLLNWWDFKTRRGSRASDIMAFELVAGWCVVYLAVFGIIGSYGLFGFPNEKARLDALNDFYARSEFVENYLIYPMISYQGWNVILCLFNADLRDPAMIGHHLVSATVAYFGLYPFGHFGALFYFGVAEATNIPLTAVDVFKYFPELARKYSLLNEFCRYSFALSFVILRLILWPMGAIDFWTGCADLLQTGKAHSRLVVGSFLIANLFLTGLQFFWGSKIFGFLFKAHKKTKKSATGNENTSSDEKSN